MSQYYNCSFIGELYNGEIVFSACLILINDAITPTCGLDFPADRFDINETAVIRIMLPYRNKTIVAPLFMGLYNSIIKSLDYRLFTLVLQLHMIRQKSQHN